MILWTVSELAQGHLRMPGIGAILCESSGIRSMNNVLDSIKGTRIQDETGAKYIVKGYRNDLQETYIILESTLGTLYYVNLDRYDEMISLPINNPKSWDKMAKVPYTITAWGSKS